MNRILVLFFLISSFATAKDINLSEKSADRLIVKQTVIDTMKLVSIDFKSSSKKFKYECDSTDLIFKGQNYTFDYTKLNNYSNQIIYQAVVKFISKGGKAKTETITIFNESERINPRGETMQCMGTTKKGSRCSRTTNDPSGYCWQHK